MRLPLLVVMVVIGCDSGKKPAPAPPPPASPPAIDVAIDAAATTPAANDPWVTAPSPPMPSGPPPSDEAIATLVKKLTSMRRSKKGPGLCLATGVEKGCQSDADCAISEVITDKCRTTYRIGVSVGAKLALDSRLIDPCASAPCPACVVRWMITEDCDDSGDAAVSCVKGRCTTHNVPR